MLSLMLLTSFWLSVSKFSFRNFRIIPQLVMNTNSLEAESKQESTELKDDKFELSKSVVETLKKGTMMVCLLLLSSSRDHCKK